MTDPQHARIDIELTGGADFCVRETSQDLFTVELGTALERVTRDDLERMAEAMAQFRPDSASGAKT